MNRLHLNFDLETNKERSDFLAEYLTRPEFQKKPPTEEELETMANYVLWGRDPDSGKNVVQSKEIQIETKNKTWDRQEPESLEGLLESTTFNEASLQKPSLAAPKIPREVFDREAALAQAPPATRAILQDLFAQIDELELAICFYDLEHGKRKKPPREELLRLAPDIIERAQNASQHWNQFNYLKRRHLLVELRRQQFTLRDSFAPVIQRHSPPILDCDVPSLALDAEIPCLPLGLKSNSAIARVLFRDPEELAPIHFTGSEIDRATHFLWENRANSAKLRATLDLRDPEHLAAIFKLMDEFEDRALDDSLETPIAPLLDTINFYVEMAGIDEAQKEILDLKVRHTPNQEIAALVNSHWGKTYTANYISTIFHQKVLPRIAAAASEHEKIIENLAFPEEFKTCTRCGRSLLRDPDHFMRRARSSDGLGARCKQCEKEIRGKAK